ncbi:uncharacterized protein K460DRAFT_104187 [Cucurbitaria berberidis CBS 394.84]|uniref:Uncharacterized protein n=1 Tax=Cucurbitaria berberidis CBS 394.84 TaxID=1168544 RepID=A0A9P4GH73_9PLEO|nr:uncharacterized protein K460DRAFT_104187 [Cucurbitaria berberidis CBS 394.84]KAF1845156.1 hypothetical protein K460DRAFT_104187 [Cucurbitaria berberidis CBS 394.84]
MTVSAACICMLTHAARGVQKNHRMDAIRCRSPFTRRKVDSAIYRTRRCSDSIALKQRCSDAALSACQSISVPIYWVNNGNQSTYHLHSRRVGLCMRLVTRGSASALTMLRQVVASGGRLGEARAGGNKQSRQEQYTSAGNLYYRRLGLNNGIVKKMMPVQDRCGCMITSNEHPAGHVHTCIARICTTRALLCIPKKVASMLNRRC